MINSKQIFKAGREKKIFEVNDNLQVNNFYFPTGYTNSSLHGKMSRISIVIVDITKGTKSQSQVLKFNFKVNEWLDFQRACRQVKFKDYCKKYYGKDFFYMVKANPYEKYDNGFISVKQISVYYEENMRTNKWKVIISAGKARPKENIGYDIKTYSEIGKTTFFLSQAEIEEMLRNVERFLKCWEIAMFPTFLKNREAFEKRLRENQYDETRINEWNTLILKKSANSTNNETDVFVCSECNQNINKNMALISQKRYGVRLCSKCTAKKMKNA